jgi:hypothetical protein
MNIIFRNKNNMPMKNKNHGEYSPIANIPLLFLRFSKIFLLLIMLFSMNLLAKNDSTYTFNIEVGAGIVNNIKPNQTDIEVKAGNKFVYPSIRFLWKPDNKLNIGIHSAYLIISRIKEDNQATEFGKTQLDLRTSAIPVMLLFNMDFWGVQLNGALGSSYTVSNFRAFESKVISYKWLNTFYGSIGYNYNLNSDMHVGLEAELYAFSELKSSIIAFKAKFGYDIFTW